MEALAQYYLALNQSQAVGFPHRQRKKKRSRSKRIINDS
jgi:hypothetical protein